jgi:hypothetical protein
LGSGTSHGCCDFQQSEAIAASIAQVLAIEQISIDLAGLSL